MSTIDIDGEDAGDGLIALVLAVVEILEAAMEREAIRRMESGELTDEEVERLGNQLAAIDAQISQIEEDHDLTGDVDDIRGDLDGIVDDLLQRVDDDGTPRVGE